MRHTLALVFAALLAGCMAPATPGQRLADSAHEVSDAMRFGRADVAFSHMHDDVRVEIAKKHAAWGRTLRVVDVEIAGLAMSGKDEADVTLNVTWQRPNEAEIRITVVAQKWKDDRGWRIVSEERASGDHGLLGDDPPAAEPAAPPANRFATRTIRGE